MPPFRSIAIALLAIAAVAVAVATPVLAGDKRAKPPRTSQQIEADELAKTADKLDRMGNFDAAAEMFGRAFELAPVRAVYLYRHGRALWLADKSAAAIAALQRVVALPGAEAVIRSQASLELAQLKAQRRIRIAASKARKNAAIESTPAVAPPPIVPSGSTSAPPARAPTKVAQKPPRAPRAPLKPNAPLRPNPPLKPNAPNKSMSTLKEKALAKTALPRKAPLKSQPATTPKAASPRSQPPTTKAAAAVPKVAPQTRRPRRSVVVLPKPAPRSSAGRALGRSLRPASATRSPKSSAHVRVRQDSDGSSGIFTAASFALGGLAVAAGVLVAVMANDRERALAHSRLPGGDTFDLTRIGKPQAVVRTNEVIGLWNGGIRTM